MATWLQVVIQLGYLDIQLIKQCCFKVSVFLSLLCLAGLMTLLSYNTTNRKACKLFRVPGMSSPKVNLNVFSYTNLTQNDTVAVNVPGASHKGRLSLRKDQSLPRLP